MTTLNITSNIVITGGPALLFKSTIDTEAYDFLDLVIKSGDVDVQADLQPGGAVQLLAISTDWQSDPAAPKGKLSFRVKKDAGAPVFKLDDPVLFAGSTLAALGAGEPKSLFLSNSTADPAKRDAKVRILVAREATP